MYTEYIYWVLIVSQSQKCVTSVTQELVPWVCKCNQTKHWYYLRIRFSSKRLQDLQKDKEWSSNRLLAVQVYSQPVFAFAERWLAEKFPNSSFINKSYASKLLLLPAFQVNVLRLCFRTFYVLSTTGIAMIFPYFNQVLGVLGALNFWPIAVYYPVQMYFAQSRTATWTRKWLVLQAFSLFCLVLSVVGLIGSVEGLITAKFN